MVLRMSEGWTIHACDVRLRNLSQVDGYKVLVPLLIKEMESRVVNPFWNDSSAGDDSSVEELASEDGEINHTNNAFIVRSENDNMKTKSVTLGSFEEVLNSIKFSPSKKAVNKDAIKDSDPIPPPNMKDKVNRDAIKDSDPVIPPNIKDKVNRDAIKESDLIVTTNVKVGVNHDAIKQSDIVLEKVDRDKVFDSESSDNDSDGDSIEFVGETASKMPKLLESVERSRSVSSDVMEITSETEFVNLAISDDPNDDTRWEHNPDTGKYQELGSNPKGFKLKKMAVRVKEEHDFNKYLATGPVKVRVKMRNVRKQLGMLNKTLDESIIVETRTDTSHPFICPFYCPVYNVPCDAMFRVTDQQFFIEHVSNRNCPYAPRAVSPVEPLVQCEKCGDDIPESKLKEHMDDNHHTHTCPGCKEKFESKIDVEDHIINEHATHFMSNLPIIYRNKRKEPPPPPEVVKTYPSPAQVPHMGMGTNTYQHLQSIAPQPPVGHSIQLTPVPPPQGVIARSSIPLAPPQGVIASVSSIRLIAPTPQGVVSGGPGPRLVFVQQPPQQQVVGTHSGQRIVVNNGQIRTSGGQLLQISPGLAQQLANHSQPAPPPPRTVILPNHAKLQQLKLPSGQIVWAQPVASEPIPGSDKAKIQFKIIGPVAPQKVPGVIQINPHNPHAPTTSNTGPTRVQMVPATPTTTLPYRPIVPRVALPTAPDPKVLGFKPVRVAQPLQLLHVDKDGAPVYQHNGFQSSNVQLGAPVGQKSQLEKHVEPGPGGDVRMINGMKLVPLDQMRKRFGDDQMRSRATDHDYSNVDPLEEEGVDPLEGLDPYEDEGVDPLAGNSRGSTPIILDDCPDIPPGDDDVIDISSLCQAQVEG
eukprot:TRINITY_DN37072_c0_g1_i1.p1 TRINITY_DN37072_c0_g1~~TRINITY_DN37072_c0_g1_i1.p1  ORF type:complete len:864 (-),score=244.90 TRINITY_DN37072_c0_g1_i1:139-2730(-)